MNDFFDKFAKVPQSQKFLLVGLLVGGIGFVYYQYFWDDLQKTLARLDREYGALEKEKVDYERRKAEYLTFRQEVQKLEEEKKELLKVLPEESEIPSFLDSIQTQATLAGLDVISFTPGGEVPADVYVTVPVYMEVAGTYHQIAKFTKIVGELKRVVNIQNLNLYEPYARDGVMRLKANFQVATFRFRGETAPGRR